MTRVLKLSLALCALTLLTAPTGCPKRCEKQSDCDPGEKCTAAHDPDTKKPIGTWCLEPSPPGSQPPTEALPWLKREGR